MNKVVLLNPKVRPEDVETITERGQAMRRMRDEYREAINEEARSRRREKERSHRKFNLLCAKVFTVIVSILVGLHLAKGDMLSTCACIIMVILGATAIALNVEYDEE